MNGCGAIDDKLTDYHSADFSKYHVHSFSKKSSRINVYNGEYGDLQKVWIKTPMVKVFKPCGKGFGKYSTLTFLLGTDDPHIKKFKSYIKKLEKTIRKLVKGTCGIDGLQFKSCLSKNDPFPYHMTVNMHFVENGGCRDYAFSMYDHKNRRTSPENIESGTFAIAYIRLNYVWTNSEKYGIHFDVLQMKIIPEFYFSECLFADDTDSDKYEPKEECYHCLYCPNNYGRTHVCGNQNNSPVMNAPRANMNRPGAMSSLFDELKLRSGDALSGGSGRRGERGGNGDKGNKGNAASGGFIPQIGDILGVKLKSVKKGDHANQKAGAVVEDRRSNVYGGFVPSLGDLLNAKNMLGKDKKSPRRYNVDVDVDPEDSICQISNYEKIIKRIKDDDIILSLDPLEHSSRFS